MSSPDNFIPFGKSDLVDMYLADSALGPDRQDRLRRVASMLAAIFHHEAHDKLEELATAYRPFNPDGDVRIIRSYSDDERQVLQRQLVEDLTVALVAANYEPIEQAELDLALETQSVFRLDVAIDFDDFDELLFFRRGSTTTAETISTWRGLRREEIQVRSYDRVLMYVKFKDQAYFDAQGRDDLRFEPGSMMIKLFQSVPVADLEMLIPNAEPRMRTMDKLTMGVPAVVGGFIMLFTKIKVLTSLFLIALFVASRLGLRDEDPTIDVAALVALVITLVTFGSFLFRQWNNVKNQRIAFMKELTENLYFRNLDNDAGVLHHVLASAEEEETKEAVLAYFFLLELEATSPIRPVELDRRIEAWFRDRWDCQVDFEIDDAIAKLERLELVTVGAAGVAPVDERSALKSLNETWDDFFVHEEYLDDRQIGSLADAGPAGDRGGSAGERAEVVGSEIKSWARRQLGRLRGDRPLSDAAPR